MDTEVISNHNILSIVKNNDNNTVDSNTLYMYSQEIAALTGKKHNNVIRDIEKMFNDLNEGIDEDHSSYRDIRLCLSSYSDRNGISRKCYNLDKELLITLLTSYDVKLRNIISLEISKYIDSLDVILNALKNFEIPDDFPDVYVYTIKEVDSGNIKIGISKDPYQRLKQLQIGNSSKLLLVTQYKADNRYKDEKIEHVKNKVYNIHSEWFKSNVVISE